MNPIRPQEILDRARALAPWHFDFEILPGVKVGSLNPSNYDDPDKASVHLLDPNSLAPFFKYYFPEGLRGKRVVDVGCNAGAYCFAAAEMGAESVTGFDVHQHWLDQAEFIRSVRYSDYKNLHFRLAHATSFLQEMTPVDVTLFKGVLYHLADPIHVLLELCKNTRDVLMLDTASSDAIPEQTWIPYRESMTHLMAGVDGLAWFPGGPAAVKPIFDYAGFKSTLVTNWTRSDVGEGSRGPIQRAGRFTIIATRRVENGGGNTMK
jgi:2-polyprenyl-3-methyl-5-hydroxy-6-metoxy-1,4-benzoquinol methylase